MRFILFLSALIFCFSAQAQQVPIGQWRTHLPFSDAQDVEQAFDRIFCSTGSSFFAYGRKTNQVEVYSKVNGLSDNGISTIRFNQKNQNLLIAYNNANIDIFTLKDITNLDDIKRANILGDKTINTVSMKGDFAYLGTGFGIVVVDMKRLEIKDTYYIGSNGDNVNVKSLTLNDSFIFAGSENGIYMAPLNGANLADFQNWRLLGQADGVTQQPARHLTTIQNKVYAEVGDTIFRFTNSTWETTTLWENRVTDLRTVRDDKLLISFTYKTKLFNAQQEFLYDVVNPELIANINAAIQDESGNLWFADEKNGLVRQNGARYESIIPAGPPHANIQRLYANNDAIYVAPGEVNGTFRNSFLRRGVYYFQDEQWNQIKEGVDTLHDIISLAFDNQNDRIFVGSFGKGMGIIKGDVLDSVFDKSNSTLRGSIGFEAAVRASGLQYDRQGNLWMLNYGTPVPLHKRDKEGDWTEYSFNQLGAGAVNVSDLIIDNQGQKWATIRQGGIFVFKEDEEGNRSFKRYTNSEGAGNLGTNNVLCITKDLDGRIWVGTSEGIRVFFSPFDALTESPSDAQPIRVVVDGLVQFLLEADAINAIAVDGANRKWVGTNNGLWLFSEDGTRTIHYFNENNSPLISNVIDDIAVHPKTGEVFIGTDKGIISYRGNATQGEIIHSDVKAFPNPVRPDYFGAIAIKGLVTDAQVKITDVNGNLVFQTIANGGEAIWNGKNFSGQRAGTGVYLVYSTNSDGTQTAVTKILFIN
ncbi:MAG: ligand-binding sensor domain-containing protein [Sphingobacteriales bacterium]|jgi:ligand-binding sensor domain-containing protein